MATHVLSLFAPNHDALPVAQRRAYITQELRRLVQEGGAVLLPILQLGVSDEAQTTAVGFLASNADDDGEQIVDLGHVWRLRLKDDAQPPAIDPQGRAISSDKAGKVLVAKVGLLGGTRRHEEDTVASRAWAAQQRAQKAISGQPLEIYREVTKTPAAFALRDAIFILRQWGIGVQMRQYRKPRNFKVGEYFDADDPKRRGQDTWLVEEVPAKAPEAAKK